MFWASTAPVLSTGDEGLLPLTSISHTALDFIHMLRMPLCPYPRLTAPRSTSPRICPLLATSATSTIWPLDQCFLLHLQDSTAATHSPFLPGQPGGACERLCLVVTSPYSEPSEAPISIRAKSNRSYSPAGTALSPLCLLLLPLTPHWLPHCSSNIPITLSAFAYAIPSVWNALPPDLCMVPPTPPSSATSSVGLPDRLDSDCTGLVSVGAQHSMLHLKKFSNEQAIEHSLCQAASSLRQGALGGRAARLTSLCSISFSFWMASKEACMCISSSSRLPRAKRSQAFLSAMRAASRW